MYILIMALELILKAYFENILIMASIYIYITWHVYTYYGMYIYIHHSVFLYARCKMTMK